MINDFIFDESIDIYIPAGFTVLCDLDGTLVDTDYANYISYRRAIIESTCGTYDVEFSNDRLNRDSLKKQFSSLTASQLEVIATLKSEYFKEFVAETRLNSSLANLLTKHHKKNIIVLVTCCREKRAVEVLKHHKLLELFTRYIYLENFPQDESSNKYKTALKLLKVSKESVLIFENENSSIEAAALSGIPVKNIYRVLLNPS